MNLEEMKERCFDRLRTKLEDQQLHTRRSIDWLRRAMHPYFFVTMEPHGDSLVRLSTGLGRLRGERRVTLLDRDDEYIVALLDDPGTLHRSLIELDERRISYAEITHSLEPVENSGRFLEVQRFEFKQKSATQINTAFKPAIPSEIRSAILKVQKAEASDIDIRKFTEALDILWLNNEDYVRVSPPQRVARALWLYLMGGKNAGLFLHVEPAEDVLHHREMRILFSVGNPPSPGFLAQVIEVFNRLNLGVRRSYCLNINNGIHPYFLGTFYVTAHDGRALGPYDPLFRQLKTELYNTQLLNARERVYSEFIGNQLMRGDQAAFVQALVAWCHTNMAHNQPDRYDLGEVRRVFIHNPRMSLELAKLFELRFDPAHARGANATRQTEYEQKLAAVEQAIAEYSTGHRHIDLIRREVFKTALLLIKHTLKTNFFVSEKHGLAFRLDPAYLSDMGSEFTADLPDDKSFRITFFTGRHSAGYHVGFSDIARGGWRTILCKTGDDFLTSANTLFREAYVLAHTQHLKNKDIYEGGSKLAMVLDATDLTDRELVTQRLYKEQFGLINAFLDLIVTDGQGRAKNPDVLDYYGEEEPIELGPDENMHDSMVEFIAKLGRERGYLLGNGLISSKKVGINHKEFGVTSLGVVTFSEIVMESLGVHMRRDPFTVKMTGGTNGDVAGNAIRLLLERCPKVQIKLIVAGSGVLFDPNGLNRKELSRLVLKGNVDEFNPKRLGQGGYVIYARDRKMKGLMETYRKVVREEAGVTETWLNSDEFHREFDFAVFDVDADLFIPAGGRPETVHEQNWARFLKKDGPTCRAIVEGANSFITPPARTRLQEAGVVLIRDASANKCGVISSSYEIVANLLMNDTEFLNCKEEYVQSVLEILEKRASDEALYLLATHREKSKDPSEHVSFTDISANLSTRINYHKTRLYEFFIENHNLLAKPLYREALGGYMPALVNETTSLKRRIGRLPLKIRAAMLASELAGRIVYKGGWRENLEQSVHEYLKNQLD